MSADNGIYILITPRRDDPERFEYRVTQTQGIENVTQQDAPWKEIQPALAVSYFGECTVYDNAVKAAVEALAIEKDYGWTEYGICEVDLPFDGPFPDMTMCEARNAILAFDDPGNCQTS